MRTLSKSAGALVAAAACSLLLAPAAHATETSPELRQPLPRTADQADNAAPIQGRAHCPGVPDGQDGWHFVLPGGKATFVSLKVTFEPGGTQEITDFSVFEGADGKHAYVGSEPGAKLMSVEAKIEGSVPQDKFNLSHTCPVTAPSPSQSTPQTPGQTPSQTPSASESPAVTPSASASGSPTSGPVASPSESAPGGVAPTAAPSASESAATGATGDLAETGSSAPVGAVAGVAAALLAGGAFLVVRRRKAAQH
ncbi:LPXTG cell wall anchor domain-containing protein [Streptomyces sp. TRM64462]|uniref:LPXTG cell wall anchor domain-containing protein n=1 Tax=Streptomyces sp. TRM64462 TaxID=2741726 RepID=UPI001586C57B|nr:LPXTG cell wall anchor domain-containing protein [Streptomyces sp. TRM64462]